MKTSIKSLAIVAFATCFTMGVKAQQSDNATITASATVAPAVGITDVSHLDFKNVTPGVAKTINFVDVVTAGTANGGETTGKFSVGKGANTQITLTFTTLPTVLSGNTGTSTDGLTIPISYTAQLSGLVTPYAISGVAQGTDVVVNNNGSLQPFYQATTFNIDLGGTVTPTSSQAAGGYSADITLTATYN